MERSPSRRRPWQVATAAPAEFFASLPQLHPIAAQVLYNRGLTTATAVRAFLATDLTPHDPRGLYGTDRAVARLRRALADGETIAVHGDFDVDGVTATAILTEGLRAAGATVIPFIPLRSITGYGVHPSAVERLAEAGARVIVTGDTGTRAVEAVRHAATLGVDVIVTDHHLPGDDLPNAVAIVNPQQEHCSYPFKHLSGAGVAWKLVQALALEGLLDVADSESLLDLVALGTIVDVSPLHGENRLLVQRGLRRLAETPRPGIRALIAHATAGREPRPMDERTVAFTIGPRLNAVGRMDDAALALELLLTRDEVRAYELVQVMEAKNSERQQLTERVLVAARAQAAEVAHQPVLVLRGEDWPSGVIGLVAARIAEEYRRPAFVVDVRPDACRGSGRSVDGFDLVEALTGCSDLLLEFGGHAQAAGFALRPDHLDALVARLVDAAAAQQIALADAFEPIFADYHLAQHELDWPLHSALTALRPFGAGNAEPLFLSSGLKLLECRAVGAGKHLRTRVRFGQQVVTGFGPELGGRAHELARAGQMDALYTIQVSSWNGNTSLELRLKDARPAELAVPERPRTAQPAQAV